MTFLNELFNVNFLIILGIIAIAVSFLIIYFENKLKEQNHKISSMLSLVSTIAEDLNGVKMNISNIAITNAGGAPFAQSIFNQQSLGNNENTLIEVSDDDDVDEDEHGNDSDDDSDNDSDDDQTKFHLDDDDDDEDESSSTDEKEEEHDDEDIKFLKLNIENDNIENNDILHDFDSENLDDLQDTDNENIQNEEIIEVNEDYTKEILDLKYDSDLDKSSHDITEDNVEFIPDGSKKISIDLGDESIVDTDDYKKMSVSKLRSIVVEKEIVDNSKASKLKKNELIKLLME